MRALLFALIALVVVGPVSAADELKIPVNGFVVSHDVSQLPKAVQAKRATLLKAAESGDIGKLKAIFDAETAPVTVSFGEPEDPIAYLKKESGDGNGIEILAILANVLAAPYAAADNGDGEPYYVWPYFAAMDDFRDLTPEQLVEGYRIAGRQTFEEQREVGGWLYWRAYIGPRGELQSFVAGD